VVEQLRPASLKVTIRQQKNIHAWKEVQNFYCSELVGMKQSISTLQNYAFLVKKKEAACVRSKM
jgi:hypothetical protein